MQATAFLRITVALIAFCLVSGLAASAQAFATLATFDGANGGDPYYASLVQGANGNFYGTTNFGGEATNNCSSLGFGCGTVFEITPDGTLTTLYQFCSQINCFDGLSPYAGLTLGNDGNFYGTTSGGGANYFGGDIYKVTPTGELTVLYSFCAQLNCTDGYYPYSGLIQARDGNFYGTTAIGGTYNQGVVYQITSTGTYKVLYSFCTQTKCTDGANPFSSLIQASNGRLYGTTLYGGIGGGGTVFSITTTGKLQTVHSFSYTDGSSPYAGLVQASNGSIYGTTSSGGLRNDGTVFLLSPTGKLKTIYNFCVAADCTDGANPQAGLVQGSNGELYGTTASGGTHLRGSVFEISQAGKLKTLYSFCSQVNCADGYAPYGGVAQASDGTLYGITYLGGDLNCVLPVGCGTVFSLKTE